MRRYHTRLLDAVAVVRATIEIRRGLENEDRRAAELGLKEEDLALRPSRRRLRHPLYPGPRPRHRPGDQAQPPRRLDRASREGVKAGVRAAVKRVLRAKKVKAEDFDALVPLAMEQAEARCRDWPQGVRG